MEKVKIKVKRITTIHKTIAENVQPVIIILDSENKYYHFYSNEKTKITRSLEILALAEVDDIIELKYRLVETAFSTHSDPQRKIYEVYSCKPDVQ